MSSPVVYVILNPTTGMKRLLILAVPLLLLPLTARCRSANNVTGVPTGTRPSETPTPEIGVTFATLAAPTAVVLQTTPSPLPTATATATPTPIVYVIEQGDTLLAIAIDHNTTTEAIIDLNPGIRPELLQIGQQVILPPPATPMYQPSLGTPVPIQVAITQVNQYRTPVGSVWILGQVVNEGDLAVENVAVTVSLTAGDGSPLAEVTAWVVPGILAPGAQAPFGALIAEAPETLGAPSAFVSNGQAVSNLGDRTTDLSVNDAEATIGDGRVSLRGRLQNASDQPVGRALVVTSVFDDRGRIIGYHELWVEEPLTPGESAPFAAVVTPPGGEASDFSFAVLGLIEDDS